MKCFLTISFVLLSFLSSSGQMGSRGQSRPHLNLTRRYVLWFTPTGKNDVVINGLAIGPMSLSAGKTGSLTINGANLEVVPVAFFTMIGSMFTTMINVAEPSEYAQQYAITTRIRGFSLSGGLFEPVEMSGVSLNFNTYAGISNGVEVSLFSISNYSFSGAQLSTYGNRSVEGRGLQFGLFNSCQDCTGIQIGALNRMGNRVLPLINFRFRKK